MTAALIILIILLIAAHFFRSPPSTTKADPRPRLIIASSADNEWRSKFHANCESPAEVAFLNALIDEFSLTPRSGALFADALRIDLQVEQDHYRADFLANGWLVIEVDGAAWHGSDEAKARDAKRDLYFQSLGYTVLRIAAKTALRDPSEAVRLVRAALAVGQRTIAKPPSKKGWERLAEASSRGLSALDELNRRTSRLLAVKQAVANAQIAFGHEKDVIEQAIEMAEDSLRLEAYLDSDAKRRAYDEYASKLNRQIEKYRADNGKTREPIVVPTFPTSFSASGLYSDEINQKFSSIQHDRQKFFNSVKLKLDSNIAMKKLVVEKLSQLGCDALVLEVTRASPHDRIEH